MKKIALIFAAAAIAATAAIGIAGCGVKSAESSRASSTGIVQVQQQEPQNDAQGNAFEYAQSNSDDDTQENTVAAYDVCSEDYSQDNTVAAYEENNQQTQQLQDDVEYNTVAPYEG